MKYYPGFTNWHEAIILAKSTKILVIGDIVLDVFEYGNVTRISPEVPVPVLKNSNKRYELGGSANVAANISPICDNVTICGILGDDSEGLLIKRLCEEKKINLCSTIVSSYQTVNKRRICSGTTQYLRIDNEVEPCFSVSELENYKSELTRQIDSLPDIIIVSDYLKGAIDAGIYSLIISSASKHDIPVIVDPKRTDLRFYEGCTFIKPNINEMRSFLEFINPVYLDSPSSTWASITADLLKCNVLFSMSEKGLKYFDLATSTLSSYQATATKVFDVTGAGDTVVAYFAVFYIALGNDPRKAAWIANVSAASCFQSRYICTFSSGHY